MNEVYLLTGGNLYDRVSFLQNARRFIEMECGAVTAFSSLYETAPWGKENQDPFLNQVLCIQTDLPAPALLASILGIEKKLGRERKEKYGPRTIDIDILFYNDDVIDTPCLQVPHPRMGERRFVLTPLQEIAPHKVHPSLGITISQMLMVCPDKLPVNKFVAGDA